MKKIVTLIFSLFILTTISSFSFATENSALLNIKKAPAKNAQVLFVMLSKEAALQNTDKPGIYKLTLKGLNPKVIYFSNHPDRVSGHLATAKFVKQWSSNGVFSKDSPNAMLETVELNAKTDKLQNGISSYALVLSNPSFSNQNELNFEVKSLTGKVLPSIQNSDYVAIFIDDVCLSCIG